jgi:hypothetical protein
MSAYGFGALGAGLKVVFSFSLKTNAKAASRKRPNEEPQSHGTNALPPALRHPRRRPMSEPSQGLPVVAWAIEANITAAKTRAFTSFHQSEEAADKNQRAHQAMMAGCERIKVPLTSHTAATEALIAREMRIRELEKDAARYRHLRELPVVKAQAFFWTYSSRKQRDAAIDAAMAAASGEGK